MFKVQRSMFDVLTSPSSHGLLLPIIRRSKRQPTPPMLVSRDPIDEWDATKIASSMKKRPELVTLPVAA
jgi:hypothetical protein